MQRIAGRSSIRLFNAFQSHVNPRLPKNRWDPLYNYYQIDFSGESYMHNPHELIINAFRWTRKEVGEYIGLASYRNYSIYKITGDKTLDLFHSPVDQDIINNNRLLRIKDGKIYFYYEEDTTRRNKIWH